MLHLARELQRRMSCEVKLIRIPTNHLRALFLFYRLYVDLVALRLRLTMRRGDTVWLMEYMLRTVQQSDAAHILRGGGRNVIATAHLVPGRLKKHYSRRQTLSKIRPLDRLYTLGTSLRDYFTGTGAPSGKVKATFHYVDTDYYKAPLERHRGERLKVIALGNMERDFDTLRGIASRCPQVDFTVCLGMKKTDMFDGMANVRTVGFVAEEELRRLMQEADVSLNTMYDTIGSNVITTSLACGLPVIASAVGSIGDYVDDGVDGILFHNADEGVAALERLAADRQLLESMSAAAARKAQELSIDRFVEFMDSELTELTESKKGGPGR